MRCETKGTILDALLVIAIVSFCIFIVSAIGSAISLVLGGPVTPAFGWLMIGLFVASMSCGVIHLKFW